MARFAFVPVALSMVLGVWFAGSLSPSVPTGPTVQGKSPVAPVSASILERILQKGRIARQVAEGEHDLLSAAAAFRALDRAMTPEERAIIKAPRDERWYCRNVIQFVRYGNGPRGADLADRLQEQFDALCGEETLTLPVAGGPGRQGQAVE